MDKEQIMREITQFACDKYGENMEEIVLKDGGSINGKKIKTRKQDKVFLRMAIIYSLKTNFILSLNTIGKFFGGRDHTSIIYARDEVINMLKHENTRIVDMVNTINDKVSQIKMGIISNNSYKESAKILEGYNIPISYPKQVSVNFKISALMIPCICINDIGRPTQIPINKWVTEGNTYHIIDIEYYKKSKNLGFVLYELPLGENEFPFLAFDSRRFALTQDGIKQLEEMLKQNNEQIDIDELIGEVVLDRFPVSDTQGNKGELL